MYGIMPPALAEQSSISTNHGVDVLLTQQSTSRQAQDSAAPTAAPGSTAKALSERANWSSSASADNPHVTACTVDRDDVDITTTSALQDTGLAAEKASMSTGEALEAAGGKIAASSAATVSRFTFLVAPPVEPSPSTASGPARMGWYPSVPQHDRA